MAFSETLFGGNNVDKMSGRNLMDNVKNMNEMESKSKRSIVIRSVPLEFDEQAMWNMCSVYGKIINLRNKQYPKFSMYFVDYSNTRLVFCIII